MVSLEPLLLIYSFVIAEGSDQKLELSSLCPWIAAHKHLKNNITHAKVLLSYIWDICYDNPKFAYVCVIIFFLPTRDLPSAGLCTEVTYFEQREGIMPEQKKLLY